MKSLFLQYPTRWKILTEIQKNQQSIPGIASIHRIDYANAGDYFSAPYHYFSELNNTALDINGFKKNDMNYTSGWSDIVSNSHIIVGGGGLLNRNSFAFQMRLFEYLASKGKKIVLWGVGHNSKNIKNHHPKYNVDINRFGMVGVRDFKGGASWVPCASCLHPIFDIPAVVERDTVLIMHRRTLKNKEKVGKIRDFHVVSNSDTLENIVAAIKSSDHVVTDSYHAMYWSILCGKKVVILPNSSKFFDFKYMPLVSSFDDFSKVIPRAISFDGVLEECREVNRVFAQKVFTYIGA